MTPDENLRLLHRVLRVVGHLDERDSLYLTAQTDGSVTPWTIVNDVFAWACSDAEDITTDNVAVYEQSAADFERLIPRSIENVSAQCNASWDVGVLFACRVRKQRPFKHDGKYPTDPRLWPLIEEAGPAPACPTPKREEPTR